MRFTGGHQASRHVPRACWRSIVLNKLAKAQKPTFRLKIELSTALRDTISHGLRSKAFFSIRTSHVSVALAS